MKSDALSTDASQLRALLEAKHGAPAMHWKDLFALGCWLYHTGHDTAGYKMVKEVLSTVHASGSNQYLDAVSKGVVHDPTAFALSIWAHNEIVELFTNRDA